MSPSLSWIDPVEMDALFDRAGVTSSRPGPARGAIPAKPTRPHFPIPTMAEDPTPPATLRPAPAPTLDAPSVTARITALTNWLDETVSTNYYIADPQGLAIATRGPIKGLVVASVALERAIRSLRSLTGRRNVGAVTIELGANQTLETIWTETRIGRVAVGVFGQEPLPRTLVHRIRESVTRVFDWER